MQCHHNCSGSGSILTHLDSLAVLMFVDRLKHCLLERSPYQLQPKQFQMTRMASVPVYDFHCHSLEMVSPNQNAAIVIAIAFYICEKYVHHSTTKPTN